METQKEIKRNGETIDLFKSFVLSNHPIPNINQYNDDSRYLVLIKDTELFASLLNGPFALVDEINETIVETYQLGVCNIKNCVFERLTQKKYEDIVNKKIKHIMLVGNPAWYDNI